MMGASSRAAESTATVAEVRAFVVRKEGFRIVFFILVPILAAAVTLNGCSPAAVVGSEDSAGGGDAGTQPRAPVETPQLSPSPGVYSTRESIAIRDSTTGATIHYTTDGATATTSSPVYAAPIPMAANNVELPISAIAAGRGLGTSAPVSGTYMLRQLAEWAETDSGPADDSVKFSAAAVDSSGDIIAAGSMTFRSLAAVSFGNGVSLGGGPNEPAVEGVLVMYSPTGQAQWAEGVASSGASNFSSVAVDSSGDIYVAGRIHGPDAPFNFGSGVSVTGVASMGDAVLVKYNLSGQAQWAVTTQPGSDQSAFTSVALDSSGDIYAAGFIGYSYTTSVAFGNGVTVKGPSFEDYDAALVRYSSAGVAQWARTPVAAPNGTTYYAVATDAAGDIYVAGSIIAPGTYAFGTDVTVTSTDNSDGVLVKYGDTGSAVWAHIVGNAIPRSVAVGSLGDVYLATSGNAEVLKYDPAGGRLWNAAVVGTGGSAFFSVALDGSGNLYAAGDLSGAAAFDFGNSVYAVDQYPGNNVVVVQYDAATGAAQWAQTAASASSPSEFYSVCAQSELNVYAVGMISGTSSLDLGDDVSVSGSGTGSGSLVVKYF